MLLDIVHIQGVNSVLNIVLVIDNKLIMIQGVEKVYETLL